MTFEQAIKEFLDFAIPTFKEATALSSLEKCRDEIEEIEFDIVTDKNPTIEYVDALMCLFDSAARHGITVDEIITEFIDKTTTNINRTWIKNDNNTYSHL